jgi:glycosyltransferase involved in cell wall biosynthesis
VSKKKILIITYYWPPSGGSGVQRWLKFVKYLPQFGWKPFVFTPENPAFDNKDESLLRDVPAEAEVIHFPIWEPYHLFFKISALFGTKKSAKPTALVKAKQTSFFEKVSTWIRGNLIIPDPRIFWRKPSVKFLKEYLDKNEIEIIITTGPPHSIHLIGYDLKNSMPRLKWIADFRDPWSEWGLLDSLNVSAFVRRIHKRLEFKVLSTADIVTTITPFYVRHFEKLGNRKVELLTNGFDGDDFKNLQFNRSEKFVIRHVGIINEKCDPRPFIDAISGLIRQNPQFAENAAIEFIGEVHPDFKAYVSGQSELNNVVHYIPTMPHKKLLGLYGSSSMLLIVLHGYKDSEGYMPGKLFEYMATGLPILGVGPAKGDAARLLQETRNGVMIEASQVTQIQNYITDVFTNWKNDTGSSPGTKGNFTYSRQSITQKLVGILDKL